MTKPFPTVSVKDYFICAEPRPATEAEKQQGLPDPIPGYRLTKDTFMNHLIPIIHNHPGYSTNDIARILGVEKYVLNGAVKMHTGISCEQLIDEYILLVATDLKDHSKLNSKEMAKRMGLSESGLFRYWKRNFKESPIYGL